MFFVNGCCLEYTWRLWKNWLCNNGICSCRELPAQCVGFVDRFVSDFSRVCLSNRINRITTNNWIVSESFRNSLMMAVRNQQDDRKYTVSLFPLGFKLQDLVFVAISLSSSTIWGAIIDRSPLFKIKFLFFWTILLHVLFHFWKIPAIYLVFSCACILFWL